MRKIIGLLFLSLFLFISSCKKDKENSAPVDNEVSSIITTNFKQDATLKAGETYTIQGSIYVDGCTLKIEPGVTVKFAEKSSLIVGFHSQNSVLIAKGTELLPIKFTSTDDNKHPGGWNNIRFENGTSSSSRLENCIIEYAGGLTGNNGAIDINNCKVSIVNCKIQDSGNRGVDLNGNAEFLSFTGNYIKTCSNEAIRIDVNKVHTIGDNNIIEDSPILVNSGDFTLEYSQTWKYQTTPYFIDGNVRIFFQEGSKLVIAPGNTLKFAPNSQLIVGANNVSGTLVAKGTLDSLITFTSSEEQPYNGDWKGIVFDKGATGASLLDYCKIEYAGNDEFYKANIIFKNINNTIRVSNCKINYSNGWGIYVDSLPQVELYNNTFEGNFQGDVFEN